MLVALLENPKPVEQNPLALRELPQPGLQDREILIRVSTCGICHTDLHTVEGELQLPRLPLVPGHQIVGRVAACGPAAKRFHEGDRVGIPWLRESCGHCRFCVTQQENLCESAQFTGLHADGGFAEFTKINDAFAYALPRSFSDVEAAPLLCAGVIGYRALRLCGIRKGERLGLFGFGASAHLAIQIARYWNCDVYVFTRSKKHRDLARSLGASWTGGSQDSPPHKIQSAIIFAPAGPLVLDALRILDKGGTVALAGIYMTPLPEIDYASLLYHERSIRSVANATRQDAIELLRLADEVPLKTEVEEFILPEINTALTKLKHSEIRGAGVLRINAA
ncbi:MAG: zinc-dependent alcohol dehydrogenase family protein [Acidobacteriia bacterium]|nr:zinc-dependent alcohol dehydrogenase family protein [Terriglobia bacterium]